MMNWKRVSVFALGALLLLGLLSALFWTAGTSGGNVPELLQMALMIVIALTTLMTLLFLMAAGFTFLNLTDVKQALVQ